MFYNECFFGYDKLKNESKSRTIVALSNGALWYCLGAKIEIFVG